jgi:hypothetical protein
MRLIVSGCSFTDTRGDNTWPIPLQKKIGCELHSVALSSQSNGLICRKLIHAISQESDYNNLLVGVMWSGPDRSEAYTTDQKIIEDLEKAKTTDTVPGVHPMPWVDNPTTFVQDDPGGWMIHNVHWNNRFAKNHYKYYDKLHGHILTYELILYTQLFLERHKIKYFMMGYTDDVFHYQDHACTKHLIDQINWRAFVSTLGQYDWCNKYSVHKCNPNDQHPTREQHAEYVRRVILPWLSKKKYI